MNDIDAAHICRALGESNRLKILKMLTCGERCACRLLEALEISQSTLSHHMKILCECALVTARRDGKWNYYTLNCETFRTFKDFLGGISCSVNGECECCK